MKVKKSLCLGVGLLLVAVVIVVGWFLLASSSPPAGFSPPAPDAPEAPRARAGNAPGAKASPMPEYHWPADFTLPLEIKVDAPPAPDELSNPSRPADKKEK
ncbi:MAG: hypothetical protein ABSF26_13510 [Thermoguttaceae bacterium]|jgi:hypothetical protein